MQLVVAYDKVRLAGSTTLLELRAKIVVLFALLGRHVGIDEHMLTHVWISRVAQFCGGADGSERVSVRRQRGQQAAGAVDVSRWFTQAGAADDSGIDAQLLSQELLM